MVPPQRCNKRTYSKIAKCAYRLLCLVASMYLGVVLCVTSVQGDCLQIQATIQVDSGDNVSIRGKVAQWYKIHVSHISTWCMCAWNMVRRANCFWTSHHQICSLFFLCLLKGSVAIAINSFRLLAARLSATHTPAHTTHTPPPLLHFLPLSPFHKTFTHHPVLPLSFVL